MMYRKLAWFGLYAVALVLVAARPGVTAWAAEETPLAPETKEIGKVPYVPTPQEVVDAMLKMADVKSSDVVFDLGCGDGRIVVAAAKMGARRCYGVDIDPERIKEARELAKKEGVEKKCVFMQRDVFRTNVSSATVVTMYLLPSYNAKLQPRLERQLKVGSRVVSHDFDMPPSWVPVETKEVTVDSNPHKVFLWKITPEMKKRAREAGAAAKKAKKTETPM